MSDIDFTKAEKATALASVDGDYPVLEKAEEGHSESFCHALDYQFSSESVAEGHPDKLCDAISDAVVDLAFEYAVRDSYPLDQVRVACETLATTNTVVLAGELRVSKSFYVLGPDGEPALDSNDQPVLNTAIFDDLVRSVIKDIGYDQNGFSWRNVVVQVKLHGQSADIAQGVDDDADEDKDIGAGDQGIMFGYATNETDSYMPAPIHYAHKLTRLLADVRKSRGGVLRTLPAGFDCSAFDPLGPDAKSQITFQYKNGKPVFITAIVVSSQYTDEKADEDRVNYAIDPIIEEATRGVGIKAGADLYVNPTGKFVIGGPDGDAGLTGRKIIVDTYGGAAPHGGGAFSGKDPTKVDRSAAYAARYIAKNIVASGLADRCTIQLSYAIGISEPVSVFVDTHATSSVPISEIHKAIIDNFDLTPRGIINRLQLLAPIYRVTAAGGHFGRDSYQNGGLTYFPWEKLDAMEPFKALLEKHTRILENVPTE